MQPVRTLFEEARHDLALGVAVAIVAAAYAIVRRHHEATHQVTA